MFVCPNCGELIDIQSTQSSVTCEHCHEVLLVSTGSRIVLANPIRTYLSSDRFMEKDESQQLRFSAASRPPISVERKKRTAQLAYERMTRQEQLDRSGLIYGILAIVFGALLGVLGWLRLEYIQTDWVGWLGLWIGVFIFALGLFVTIWFFRSIRSAQTVKREIEKELKHYPTAEN